MPHRPGHPEPGFRAEGSTDEQIRKRQAQLRNRAGLGNRNATSIFQKAQAAGTKAVGAVKDTAARGASGLRSFVSRGGGTQTRAERVAERLQNRGRTSAGGQATGSGASATGQGATRAAATQAFEQGAARTPSRLAQAGRFVKGALLPAAGAGIALEAATTTQEEQEAASGIPPVTPLRGTGDPGTGPQNLERFGDPALAAIRPAVGVIRGAFGGGAEPAGPGGTGDLTRQGSRGLVGPASPTPTGLRDFTNADIGGGAVNRGTASVEENQGVAQRLSDRGASLRAAGLAAQPQPGQPGQADSTATRLAGGGLASAFGALALSGNQLRREAAERTRGAATTQEFATQQQKADLDLRNTLTEIGAQTAADAGTNFQSDITKLAEGRTKAGESDNPAAQANFDNAIVESALANPNGNAAQFASTMLGKALFDLGPQTRLGAIFNPFGEGRTFLDAFEAIGRNEFNVADLQNAFEKVQIDDSGGTFRLVVPRQEGGGFEDVGDINDLPEPMQRLALQLLRRQSTGQRGDPDRANPNVATQTASGLRGFQQ